MAMKRPAIILVAIIILVIGALIVGPRFIPPDIARDRIAEQITQWIGRTVTFSGEPDISLFPRPSVRLKNVRIAGLGGDDVFIVADELTGTFRYLPLLWGAIEVNSFELVRPVIALRVGEDGQSNWAFEGTLGDRIAGAFEDGRDGGPERITEIVLGRFAIVDGTITFDRPGADLAVLSDVELDVLWPSTGAAATAEGSLVWRNERIDIAATLSEPLELIAGRASPARFTITGQPVRIAFDGTVGRSDLDFAFDGEASATMPSLRRLISWVGTPMAEGATLAGAGFSGDASWAWPVLSFSNAEMRLDGNVAGGAVSIDFGEERTRIVGTLAFEELDVSPYADAFRADVEADGEWRDAPIDLPALADVDWDVRLSADRLIVGATRIDGFAASAIVNDGVVDLRLAEAGFYGGRIEASLSGQLSGASLSASAELTVAGANARPASADIIGVSPLSGRADAIVSARSEGESWGELVQRMTGSAQLFVANGAIRGIDLGAAAAPAVAAVVVSTGETAFNELTARLTISGGQLIADRLAVAGPGYDIAFTGWGSLTSPAIGGVGVVWLRRADDTVRELPFSVTGEWLTPIFADDPGAAALVGPGPGAAQ